MPRIDRPASPLVPRLQGLHLFHYDGAPCAQRVRFALAEKGLRRGREVRFDADDAAACAGEPGAWVSRHVSLVRKEHFTPAYALIQPNLVVPALVHDGVLYTESMDIVAYVDQRFGGEPLIPSDDAPRLAEVQALVRLGETLHRAIRFVTFRWGLRGLGRLSRKEETGLRALLAGAADGEGLVSFYSAFDGGTIAEAVYRHHLAALKGAFDHLERRLDDGRAFLTGPSLTMADVIWSMKVLRLDECGYPFAELHPALLVWFRRVFSRPAFQAGVMGRHRLWHRVFLAKSRAENLLGIGLRQAAVAVPAAAPAS